MFDMTTKKAIGRLTALTIASAFGIAGLGAAPVAADAPAGFTFTNIIPCSGEEIDVTITFHERVHLGHDGRFVGQRSVTGTTSDGYVMEHGRERIVFNGNNASGSLNDTWRNADGSMFKAQGHFLDKDGELVVDSFRLRCVKA